MSRSWAGRSRGKNRAQQVQCRAPWLTVGEVEVRGLPEGAVFSPDGRWLYVGNFIDGDLSVLRVDGDTVTNTGTLIKLPGKPASMRGRTQ